VFIVYWGSQWGNVTASTPYLTLSNDSASVAPYQQQFLAGLYGPVDKWSTSTTQYCQGVPSGTTNCGSAGAHVGHPTATPLLGAWADNGAAAPSQPTQSQLAQEAVKAANQAGILGYSFNPLTDQVIVSTFSHNNSSGFGTQYCAWHSSISFTYGGVPYSVAYTNLPYITDGGASCGANFNGLGPKAGITIIEGHELAETITDQFPNSGWLDGSGNENGDKCAWIGSGNQGAAADITLPTGTYPVQSLWSNAFNGKLGGCVLSY
jgi:serine protease